MTDYKGEVWSMTEEEKKILLELFPEADIGYDNSDQLIIYTGRYAEDQMPAEDWSDEPQKIVCKNNLENDGNEFDTYQGP